MKERVVLEKLERYGPAEYVGQIRARGRGNLDPDVRAHMAELYRDLRALLREDRLSPAAARVLRTAQPVLESEWKLNGGEPAAADPRPLDTPGMRYLPYSNLRVVNAAIGTNQHATDREVRRRAWEAIQYIANTWLAYETRTALGTESWNQDRLPPPERLDARIELLNKLAELAGQGLPPSPLPPEHAPERWADLPGNTNTILEFLSALPQTLDHDEVLFLRTIHLTECFLAGTLVHVMAAIEFLKRHNARFAAVCLARANEFAAGQTLSFRLVKTMPVDSFMAFRDATGDASAVQSANNQLLMIHVLGVDPEKVEALAAVPENSYILQYANPKFVPLKRALQELDRSEPGADAVLDQARHLDAEMCKWRANHFGVANRYLPEDAAGTGGTSGAPYLKRFYLHRLFHDDQLDMTPVAIPAVPQDALRQRARPILGWEN